MCAISQQRKAKVYLLAAVSNPDNLYCRSEAHNTSGQTGMQDEKIGSILQACVSYTVKLAQTCVPLA